MHLNNIFFLILYRTENTKRHGHQRTRVKIKTLLFERYKINYQPTNIYRTLSECLAEDIKHVILISPMIN